MKDVDPEFLEASRAVFTSSAPPSLEDIRKRVAAGAVGTTRRDMLSALNRVEDLFDRPLSKIQANAKTVRELLRSKSGPQLGVSTKAYANICSGVRAALRDYGEAIVPVTVRVPHTATWSALLTTVAVEHHRTGLYRLASYCSAMKIEPEAVGPEALVGFHAALDAEEVVKHPRKLLKLTMALWNMCGRRVVGWPAVVLSSPFRKEPFAPRLETLPQSFQDDVAKWKKRVSDPDLFDRDAPDRPLKAVTVKDRVMQIRRFAGALIARGELTIDEITGLAIFFDPDRFKSALRHMRAQKGGKPTQYLRKLADNLRLIAKHYCLIDARTLEDLAVICRQLGCGSRAGMSERNRKRLRQFDDPENVAKLLAFPGEERARALKMTNVVRAARCMERALVIDLLIHCVPRIQNLRTIDLTTDLHVSGDIYHLSFDGHLVKNEQPLEFELPPDVSRDLREFLETYRPRLSHPESAYLFVGIEGGPRSANALRAAIEETLRKNAGLEMHPHLFRHAIAKIVVERDPGAYAVMSRQLGHRRMDTTMANYLGTEGRAAARHINRLLNEALADPTIPRE